MPKHNEITLKEALQLYLKSIRAEGKMHEPDIRMAWRKLMGQFIVSRTQSLIFKEGQLTISLSSPALRQELEMGKSKIRELLNQELENEVIREIIIR